MVQTLCNPDNGMAKRPKVRWNALKQRARPPAACKHSSSGILVPQAVSRVLPAGQRLVAAADAAVRDAAAAAAPSLARCNDMENGAGTDTEDDPMQSTPPKRSRKRCGTPFAVSCALPAGKACRTESAAAGRQRQPGHGPRGARGLLKLLLSTCYLWQGRIMRGQSWRRH